MQDTHFWNKLNLHRNKIIICILLALMSVDDVKAQRDTREHLAFYDEQWIHYGFLIGLHTSNYRIKYNEAFLGSAQDSVHSIVPNRLPGFKLGFIANMHVFQYLDIRASITFAFYEYELDYRFTDGTNLISLQDPTMVEFPILLKYKSQRRGNTAFYLLGGINPAFEASAKGDEASAEETLETTGFNVAIDIGIGLDLYYPLFKFSPELRYSYGLSNRLQPRINSFNTGLSSLVTHNISLIFTFEGGPK
ncbi:MAG: porin family protein [Bacteroidota bacterium]